VIEKYLPDPNPYSIEEDETTYVSGEVHPTYHVHGKRAFLTVEMCDGEPYEITGFVYNEGGHRTFATMHEALSWLAEQERGE
jgi:hypothetical protein